MIEKVVDLKARVNPSKGPLNPYAHLSNNLQSIMEYVGENAFDGFDVSKPYTIVFTIEQEKAL